jgi:gamma-glutamyltranspeptidase / glutathione hydrolase
MAYVRQAMAYVRQAMAYVRQAMAYVRLAMACERLAHLSTTVCHFQRYPISSCRPTYLSGDPMIRLSITGYGIALILSALLSSSCGRPPQAVRNHYPALPEAWAFSLDSGKATARHGMVASDAPLATEAGVSVLRSGGNAVDAAIATAFALAVVLPAAGNIGGGGFMVARMADGAAYALDFRETAPQAASRNMYLDKHGRLMDRSLTGHLAAGVPGTVAGLWEAHRNLGVLPWPDLLAPAIRLADSGFVASEGFVDHIRGDSTRLARYAGSFRLFLPHGRPPTVGEIWRDRDLAQTLRRISLNGPSGFYRGTTADLIVREMKRGRGIITRRDLQSYRAVWRTPITTEYRRHHIISMPPPSSGGVTLALMLHMIEQYPLAQSGWHSTDAIHVVVESMRRAYADRNYYLGDPAFVKNPVDTLLSRVYATRRLSNFQMAYASPSSEIAPGPLRPVAEGMHTTHFSVADSAGNAVALTYTLNTGFGSAVTVSGAGFLLNNEMDDFASKPGSQNVFGLVQGEANAIKPGKRMLSSMTPTVVLDPQGKVMLITGASGGPRITTGVLQVISNMVDFGMNIAEAVNAPRFHHQHLPDRIMMENDGFLPATLDSLRGRRHTTQMQHHLAIASSIARKDSMWEGCADPRMAGRASGY